MRVGDILQVRPDLELRLVDGLAAGTAWMVFEPVSGPHAGKKLAVECGFAPERVTYRANVVHDDGFGINCKVDCQRGSECTPCGYDLVPELDGLTFWYPGLNMEGE